MPVPSVLKWFRFHLLPLSLQVAEVLGLIFLFRLLLRLTMNGGTPPLPLFAFMTLRGKTLPFFANGYFLSTGHFSVL